MDLNRPEDSSDSQEAAPKPLGRGLEQISHLFLTHETPDRRSNEVPPDRGLASVNAYTHVRTDNALLVRAGPPVAKDRLISVLRDNPGALEEGLRILDTFVPCCPLRDIDALAVDVAHRLTVIDLETRQDDALAVRGLAHCEWLQRNLLNVIRMHPGTPISSSAPPRLFLIASDFSALTLGAASQLTPLRISWFRYHVLDIRGSTGVFFESAI